jgi:glycosyltransferase involved in cell wall biosynthesis
VTGAPDVSVVISTYNRGDDLRDTLESLLAQQCGDVTFEAIVVDNNSTDATRLVIESYAARGGGRIRYLFEGRQGVSYGRNAGIDASRAPIVAFTDDDVILAPDWMASIAQAFAARPDVDYLTGRILPRFEAPRPAWMTPRNSGPCTIPDRGDEPIVGRRGCFFPGWATANFAIRRTMLDRAGRFAIDFPRGEDLELILRVWRAGGVGMYVPGMVITHKIPQERITKAYHRMWHTREGDIRARVRYKELFDRDGRFADVRRRTLFGVPLFLLKQLAHAAGRWSLATLRRDEADAFYHEMQMRQTFSYLRTRIRSRSAGGVPITPVTACLESPPPSR